MMLRAIIIDDEYNGIRSLELLINWLVPGVKIVGATTDPFEGVELINDYRPEIVFLDINMPALNGFDLLERLEYNKFSLIFTTAYQEYAIRAIRESATDYLLKPVDADKLKLAIDRVRGKIDEGPVDPDAQQILKVIVGLNNLKIPLPTKQSIEYVQPSMIIYVEASSNTSRIFLTNRTLVEVTKPLKEYETLLCREGLYFMRVHNSFIINLNYVNRYVKDHRGYLVVDETKKIYISKEKKDEFFNVINARAS